MTETVAEALARHEADCPVCKANYAPHCHERETVEELAELRVSLAAAGAERDRYLTRACVAEAKVAKVRELADSYAAMPCNSGCGRPDYHGCTCNAGDFRKAGKAILTAIGGKP